MLEIRQCDIDHQYWPPPNLVSGIYINQWRIIVINVRFIERVGILLSDGSDVRKLSFQFPHIFEKRLKNCVQLTWIFRNTRISGKNSNPTLGQYTIHILQISPWKHLSLLDYSRLYMCPPSKNPLIKCQFKLIY